MNKKTQLIVLLVPVLIILTGIVILMVLKPDKDDNKIFVGLFETTQIRVASEVPGRIDRYFVKLGDEVEKGQLLASIDSGNFWMQRFNKAQGVYSAAASVNEKANKGARDEGNSSHKKTSMKWPKVSLNLQINLTYDCSICIRIAFISSQQMDEMTFKRNAAEEQMKAAEAMYNMAQKGARAEDKKAAKGQLDDAVEGQVNEAMAYYKQLKIYAPTSGEVSAKMAQESEVMPAG